MSGLEEDVEAFIAAITPRQHVEGVSTSCAVITGFLAGRNVGDLASDDMLRYAVEMKFIHVGAALEELERKAPGIAQPIRHRAEFVRLYHDLTEHYDRDYNAVLWQYRQTLLADTKADAEAVLRNLPEELEIQE